MIFYLVTARHRYAIEIFLDLWHPEVRDIMTVLPYDQVPEDFSPPAGIYIFTDLERLTREQRSTARQLHRRLGQMPEGEVRILNPPDRVPTKYELLSRLHEEGINDYRAFPLNEMRRPPRWPVFIKSGYGHGGKDVKLLRTQREFETSMARRWVTRSNLRGLLVIEFCDTRDPHDGTFRKYASFVIGDQVIPRHLFHSTEWVVKLHSGSAAQIEEELDFLKRNPHEQQIRDVVRLGGFDYGRIDYSMLGDRMQVWEFNTNPVIFSPKERFHPDRMPMQEMVARDIARCFESLAASHPHGGPTPHVARNSHLQAVTAAARGRRAVWSVPWKLRLLLRWRAMKRTARHAVVAVATVPARVLRPWILRRLEKNFWGR